MITSVMIDSREPKSIQRLKFGGVPTVVTPLEAGDLWVATDDSALLVIERKTPSDFLNTLAHDRLFPQCAKMKEVSPWSYIVIDGDIGNSGGKVTTERRVTGWSWNAYQGALLTCQELGVMVTQVEDFESAVIRLAKRNRNGVTVKPPRVPSILSDGEAVIAALPGIGEERTGALMDHCGGEVGQVFHYLTDIWSNGDNVPGVGWNTKVKVRRALRLKPHEFLAVITTGEELENNER